MHASSFAFTLARRASLSAAATLAVMLAGCASTPPHGPSTSNAPLELSTQTASAYHGRFAVRYVDQNGQTRNAYGNFDWQQQGDTVTLQLLNPLGQTLAVVTSSPASATLELPNRQPVMADNVSDLMQHTLGFALPVEGLRYWLASSPAPNSRAKTIVDPEQTSHLKEIDQEGWTVQYLAYADAPASGVKRLDLTRQNPPLDIKLVLDR
ncbi:MAG: lipoprotein localization protein LolB [Paraburkholderia sp.]|nr:MAG: lipoprotein localization protein LolB [Paraburkholderia sp.]